MGIYYPNFVVFYVLSPSVPPLHRQLRQLPGSGGIPMSQKKKRSPPFRYILVGIDGSIFPRVATIFHPIQKAKIPTLSSSHFGQTKVGRYAIKTNISCSLVVQL